MKLLDGYDLSTFEVDSSGEYLVFVPYVRDPDGEHWVGICRVRDGDVTFDMRPRIAANKTTPIHGQIWQIRLPTDRNGDARERLHVWALDLKGYVYCFRGGNDHLFASDSFPATDNFTTNLTKLFSGGRVPHVPSPRVSNLLCPADAAWCGCFTASLDRPLKHVLGKWSGSEARPLGAWDRVRGGHTAEVTCCDLDGSGTRLVSGGRDHAVKLWDFASAKVLHTYEGHHGPLRQVRFSPKHPVFASTADDRTLRIVNWKTWREEAVVDDFEGGIRYSPDGRFIGRHGPGFYSVHDARTGGQIFREPFKPYDDQSELCGETTVRFSPDGRRLFVFGGGYSRGGDCIRVVDVPV